MMSKTKSMLISLLGILCGIFMLFGICTIAFAAADDVPAGFAGEAQIIQNGNFETAQEKSVDLRIAEDGGVVAGVDMSGVYVVNNIYAGTNHVFFTEYNANNDKYYDTSEQTIQQAKSVLSFAQGAGRENGAALKIDYTKYAANTSRNVGLSPKYRIDAAELNISETTKFYEISYWAKAENSIDKNMFTRPHFNFLRGSGSEYGGNWYAMNKVAQDTNVQYTLLASANQETTEWVHFTSVFSIRLGVDGHVYFRACLTDEESDLGAADNFGKGSTDSIIFEFVSLTADGYLATVPVYIDDVSLREYFPKYEATVTVYDAQQAPASGAELTVKDEQGNVSAYAIVTDNEDGTYTIANLYDNVTNIVYAEKAGTSLGQAVITYDNRVVSAGPFTKTVTIVAEEPGEVSFSFSPEGGSYSEVPDTPGTYEVKLTQETTITVSADYCVPQTIALSAASEDEITVELESALVADNILEDADANFVNKNAVSEKERELYKFSSVVGDKVTLSVDDEIGYTGTNSLKAEFADQNYVNFTLFDGENGIESGKYYKVIMYAYTAQPFGANDSSLIYFSFSPKLSRSNNASFGFVPSDTWSDYRTYCVLGNKAVSGTWTKIETVISYTYNQTNGRFTYVLGSESHTVTNVQSIDSIDFELLAATGGESAVVWFDAVSLAEYDKVITQSDIAANYIADGDFETGSSLSESLGANNAFAFTGTTTGTFDQTNEAVKNGEYALKVEFKQQNYFAYRFASSGAAALTSLPPDVSYRVTGSVKSDSADTLYIGFMVGFKDETNGPTIMAYLDTSYSKDEDGKLYSNTGNFDLTEGSNFLSYQFAVLSFDGTDKSWKDFSATFSYSISDENYFTYTINDKSYTVTDANGDPLAVPTTSAYGISFIPGDSSAVFYLDSFGVYAQYDGQIKAEDADGNPLVNATLKITDLFGNDITQSVVVDRSEASNGVYKFPDLYDPITVTFIGYEDIIDPITIDSRSPSMVAQPPYTATLKFLDPDGNVIKSGIEIIVTQNGNPIGFITYDEASGIFTIEDLVGENITVFASSPNWLFPTNNVTLQRGENTITVANKVMPSYTATITLRDEDNKPITGATIVIKKDGTSVGVVTERLNGTYTVTGLNDDGLTIEITKEGYTFDTGATISRSNANITVNGTATALNESGEEGGGCSGAVHGAVYYVSVTLLAMVAAIFLHRGKNKNV